MYFDCEFNIKHLMQNLYSSLPIIHVFQVQTLEVYKTNLQQNVADHSRAHDYGDGLLVYQERDDLREAEEGYSSAISEEEVKYDPSVWQSVIRYGPGEQDFHSADNRGYV